MNVVIFDFDGTIADSFDLFLAIGNRLADEFGYPQVSLGDIPQVRNLSSREILQQLRLSKWRMLFFLWRFRQQVRQQIPHLQPIADMTTTLQTLHQQGYHLGIVTSNSRQNVKDFLTAHHLDHLFDFISAGQPLLNKAKVLQHLVKRHHLDGQQVIYVGDETRDIEAAQQVGIPVVAVSWGFNTRQVLLEYEPNALVEQPGELVRAIERLS